MGLDGGVFGSTKIDFLKSRFPRYNDLSEREQFRLAKILGDIYRDGGGKKIGGAAGLGCLVNVGPKSHKLWAGYCSLYSKDLEKKFGPGRFREIIKELQCLEVDTFYVRGSDGTGSTMAYKLTTVWKQALDELYNLTRYSPKGIGGLLDRSGQTIKRKPPGNNAIRSRDSEGNTAKSKAFIPFSIPVNQDCLRDVYNSLKQIDDEIKSGDIILNSHSQRTRLLKTLERLWEVYYLSYNELTPTGEIAQTYTEYKSGRLYGKGISLQGSVKEVRLAALAGMPLKEIDISNCHFSIISQLAEREGLPCPEIGAYLENKRQYREAITTDIFGEEIQGGQIAYDEAQGIIKECIISTVNGAGHDFGYRYWEGDPDKYKEPAIISALSYGAKFNGEEKAVILSGHELFKPIANEVGAVAEKIISSTPVVNSRGGRALKNLMGKCLGLEGNADPQRISHIIQGAEAKLLNVILEEFEGCVYVPTHDGATVDENLGPRIIEKKIKERTGFKVKIEEEVRYRFESPASVIKRILERCLRGSQRKPKTNR